MPSTKLKQLYMASSIGELNKLTHVSLSSHQARRLCNSASKVYTEAEKCRNEGDEEKSYVLYMKFFSIFQEIKKSPDFAQQKTFCEEMIGANKMKLAVEWAEKLQESLKRRYELEEARQKLEKKNEEITIELSNKITVNKQEGSNKTIDKTPDKTLISTTNGSSDYSKTPTGSISCNQLYSLLKEEDVTVLILDARLMKDFEESHIKHSCCMNVPDDIIQAGITGVTLEKLIPQSSKSLWERRNKVDYIILLDWFSYLCDVKQNSKLQWLKDAIFKWDSRVIIKSEPLILDGGYENWILHYPMYTTNAKIPIPKNINICDPDDMSLDIVDYPNLDDGFILTPSPARAETPVFQLNDAEVIKPALVKPSIDRSKKPILIKQDSDASIKSGSSSLSLEDLEIKFSPSVSASSQKPTVLLPQVDRTLKPSESTRIASEKLEEMLNMEQTLASESLQIEQERFEKEQQFDLLRIQKEKEAEENMRLELQKQEEALLEKIRILEIDKRKKEEEGKNLQEENEKIKKNLKAVLRQQGEDAKMFEIWKEQIIHKEQEKRRLEKETEHLRQERKRKEKEKEAQKNISTKVREIEVEVQKSLENEDESKNRKEESGSIYITKLKDSDSSPAATNQRRPSLSRSHSSPNIAQMLANEDDDRISQKQAQSEKLIKPPNVRPERKTPIVNRMVKPQLETYSAARHRDLMPIYGNQKRGVTGLRNLGNTCFMNSTIQCLANTVTLAQYFKNGNYRHDLNRSSRQRGEIAEEFAVIISALWAGQYKSIAPKDFKDTVSRFKPEFAGYVQQDSQEFLDFLLNRLNDELNTVKVKPVIEQQDNDNIPDLVAAERAWQNHQKIDKSIIIDLFHGQYMSTLRCLHCRYKSVTFQPFMYITLPIPSNVNRCSLKDLLQSYLKEEKMEETSSWRCPKCGECKSSKKMDITRLPPLILFHLSRFRYEGRWRDKVETYVDFQLSLDLNPYVVGSKRGLYHLYAVSNHYGTLEGGHYTAYCLNVEYNEWFKFDDHSVSEMSSDSVKSGAAYILFYTSVKSSQFY